MSILFTFNINLYPIPAGVAEGERRRSAVHPYGLEDVLKVKGWEAL